MIFGEQPSPDPQPQPSSAAGANPLNIGFALVAAFALGLALGFFGRPQIIDDVPIQVVVTVVSNNNVVAQAPGTDVSSPKDANIQQATANLSQTRTTTGQAPSSTLPNNPTAETAPAEPTPTIMDFLMSDARHVQGNEAAPITIIEFSDFK